MEENVGLFVIDLSGCDNTGEIINNVSLALEIPNASGRGISLKLRDNVLNQSQLLSIKSLIESYNSELVNVETSSLITQNACESMGIKVRQAKAQKVQQPEVDEKSPMLDVDSSSVENSKIALAQPAQNIANEQNSHNMNTQNSEHTVKNTNNLNETARQNKPIQMAGNLNQFEELKKELPKEAVVDSNPAPEQTPILRQTANQTNNEVSRQNINKEIFDGLERQTITVYKKASEANLQNEEDFEEVDFYAPPTNEPVVIDNKQTIYVNQTLRSGQTLEFDGNIVIIGDCHPGSEIKAAGDITVWGVLGSIAHAGSKGNREARIRALKMNAVQLRIANCYSRRPDGGNIPYIVKSAIFTPEEARIVDDNIVLFKMDNQ